MTKAQIVKLVQSYGNAPDKLKNGGHAMLAAAKKG
jgi:hypothetical protein